MVNKMIVCFMKTLIFAKILTVTFLFQITTESLPE